MQNYTSLLNPNRKKSKLGIRVRLRQRSRRTKRNNDHEEEEARTFENSPMGVSLAEYLMESNQKERTNRHSANKREDENKRLKKRVRARAEKRVLLWAVCV